MCQVPNEKSKNEKEFNLEEIKDEHKSATDDWFDTMDGKAFYTMFSK